MRIGIIAALISLLVLLSEAGYGQSCNFSIYFAIGATALDDAQTGSLDAFLYNHAVHSKTRIAITGYTDELGTTAVNKRIAAGRAVSVKAYLRSSGIEDDQIVQCIGVGNATRSGADLRQRRVDIVFDDSGRAIAINRKESKTVTAPARRSTNQKKVAPGPAENEAG